MRITEVQSKHSTKLFNQFLFSQFCGMIASLK